MENLENQWCKVQNQLHTQPTHAVRCKELNPGHGKEKTNGSFQPSLLSAMLELNFPRNFYQSGLNHWPGVKPSNYQAQCDNNN